MFSSFIPLVASASVRTRGTVLATVVALLSVSLRSPLGAAWLRRSKRRDGNDVECIRLPASVVPSTPEDVAAMAHAYGGAIIVGAIAKNKLLNIAR